MSSFLDIQKVVEDWAWGKYNTNPTRKHRNLYEKQKRKNDPYIGVAIDWSGCEFNDTTVWSKVAEDAATDNNENEADKEGAAGGSPLKAAAVTGSDVNVLFQTEFANNTKSDQMYTLRIEKTTRSTCSTEVETGVTKGYELGITLKLPQEILEVNAGYKKELSVTNTSGQSFEEELHWGAESEIKVAAKNVAHAQLVVREKKQAGDFEVVTKIKGYVSVTFTHLRDNNSFLKRADGDISYVVQKYLEKKQRLGEVYPFVSVDDDTNTVTVKTKGSCRFRYGIRQEVKVDQTPI